MTFPSDAPPLLAHSEELDHLPHLEWHAPPLLAHNEELDHFPHSEWHAPSIPAHNEELDHLPGAIRHLGSELRSVIEAERLQHGETRQRLEKSEEERKRLEQTLTSIDDAYSALATNYNNAMEFLTEIQRQMHCPGFFSDEINCGEILERVESTIQASDEHRRLLDTVTTLLPNYVCTLCNEPMCRPALLPCGHGFCSACIEEAFKKVLLRKLSTKRRRKQQAVRIPTTLAALKALRKSIVDQGHDAKKLFCYACPECGMETTTTPTICVNYGKLIESVNQWIPVPRAMGSVHRHRTRSNLKFPIGYFIDTIENN